MTKLLAAIDASAASQPVLEVGSVLAERLGLEFEAVHVDEGHPELAGAIGESFGVRPAIIHGERTKALVEAFADEDVAVGVLGLRGHPGGRQPAGGTALEVIERTDKPLVLVPPQASPWALGKEGTALLPIDGSDASDDTVRALLALLRGARLDIRLLHVFDPDHVPRFADQPQHELSAWRHEFLARHADADVKLELRAGHPDVAVLECAKQVGADLIVLPCHRQTHERGNSLVLEVLGHTAVPVVILPPADVLVLAGLAH